MENEHDIVDDGDGVHLVLDMLNFRVVTKDGDDEDYNPIHSIPIEDQNSTERSSIQKTVDKLMERNKEFGGLGLAEVRDKDRELEAARKAVAEYMKQLDYLIGLSSDLNKKLEHAQNHNLDLEAKVEKLEKENYDMSKYTNDLEKRYADLQNELELKTREVEVLKVGGKNYNDQLKSLKQRSELDLATSTHNLDSMTASFPVDLHPVDSNESCTPIHKKIKVSLESHNGGTGGSIHTTGSVPISTSNEENSSNPERNDLEHIPAPSMTVKLEDQCEQGSLSINQRPITTHFKDYSKAKQAGHFCKCGYQSKSKGTLLQHFRGMNAVSLFSCSECTLKFKSTWNLRKHMLKSHKLNSTFRGCHFCGRTFGTLKELLAHQRSEHQAGKKIQVVDLTAIIQSIPKHGQDAQEGGGEENTSTETLSLSPPFLLLSESVYCATEGNMDSVPERHAAACESRTEIVENEPMKLTSSSLVNTPVRKNDDLQPSTGLNINERITELNESIRDGFKKLNF